jgi:hypothetical protein
MVTLAVITTVDAKTLGMALETHEFQPLARTFEGEGAPTKVVSI